MMSVDASASTTRESISPPLSDSPSPTPNFESSENISAALPPKKFSSPKLTEDEQFDRFVVIERRRILKINPRINPGLLAQKVAERWREVKGNESSTTTRSKKRKLVLDSLEPSNTPKMGSFSGSLTTAGFTGAIGGSAIQISTGFQTISDRLKLRVVPSMEESIANMRRETGGGCSKIAAALGLALDEPVKMPRRASSPKVVEAPVSPAPVVVASKRVTIAIPEVVVKEKSVLQNSSKSKSRVVVTRAADACNYIPAKYQTQIISYDTPSRQDHLELFYLACCEPAFPASGEAHLTPYTANYYYDHYMGLFPRHVHHPL